jgi:predicted adenylyl cyclase CyaB
MHPSNQKLEIEVRVLVDDVANLYKHLDEYGYAREHTKQYVDVYYCRKAAKTLDDVRMAQVGAYSLRVRMSERKEDLPELNVKIIVKEADHSGWTEIETPVVDADALCRILCATEFKEFFRLRKQREVFRRDEIMVAIDHIDGFGSGVEIETFGTLEEHEVKRRGLLELVEALGCDRSRIVAKSLTYLVMEQRAQF